MEAVAWVLGLGIFFGLVLAFPKRAAWLVGGMIGIAAVIAGGIFGYFQVVELWHAHQLSKIQSAVRFDTEACSEDYPLGVVFHNGSDRRVERTTFRLEGFRSGYSDPVRETDYSGYSTDRIIAPGEKVGSCWRAPGPAYGVSDGVISNNPTQTLEWRLVDVDVDFGG